MKCAAVKSRHVSARRTASSRNESMPYTARRARVILGLLGLVASLPAEQHAFLTKVQSAMTRVVKGIGGFQHSEWRSFHNDRKTTDATNFVDGDLIETFLDLPREKMEEVVAGLEVSVEELTKMIEELTQLH